MAGLAALRGAVETTVECGAAGDAGSAARAGAGTLEFEGADMTGSACIEVRRNRKGRGVATWRACVGAAALAAGAVGQGSTGWVEVPVLRGPTEKTSTALAHDEARGRTVLLADGRTWEWDGSRWIPMFPASQPGGEGLVYDPWRRRTLVVGTGSSSIWEWDGIDWIARNPANPPPGRSGAAVAFDRARGRVVLFGGFDFGGPYLQHSSSVQSVT